MVKSVEDIPFVFGCKQLAEIMGVSVTKAREVMHSEGFPVVDYGTRSHRIHKDRYLRWLEGERFKREVIR